MLFSKPKWQVNVCSRCMFICTYVCIVLSPAEQIWHVPGQPAQSCVNTCHIDWFKRGAFALKVAADLWFRQDFSSEYRGSTAEACESVYNAFCGLGELGDVLFAENGVAVTSGQESECKYSGNSSEPLLAPAPSNNVAETSHTTCPEVYTQQDTHACVCPVCIYTNVIATCQCVSFTRVQVYVCMYELGTLCKVFSLRMLKQTNQNTKKHIKTM